MRHWNGKPLLAVHLFTNGPNIILHDIVEIAFVPLTPQLELRPDVMPFHCYITPSTPELCEGVHSQARYAEMLKIAWDRYLAEDMFLKWLDSLNIEYTKYGKRKSIQLIAYKFYMIYPFLIKWLSQDTFEELFFDHVRDLSSNVNYLNDRAAWHTNEVPYSKPILQWQASKHGVPWENRKSSLDTARVIAEVYRSTLHGALLF